MSGKVLYAFGPKSLLSHEYVLGRWSKNSLHHSESTVIGCDGQTIATIMGKYIGKQTIQEFSAWVSVSVGKLNKSSLEHQLNRFLPF